MREFAAEGFVVYKHLDVIQFLLEQVNRGDGLLEDLEGTGEIDNEKPDEMEEKLAALETSLAEAQKQIHGLVTLQQVERTPLACWYFTCMISMSSRGFVRIAYSTVELLRSNTM